MDNATPTPAAPAAAPAPAGDGLAALAGQTAMTDAANADPMAPQAGAPVARTVEEDKAEQGAKEWGRIMFVIGGVVTMVAPELKPIYAEDRCFAWGLHAHAVADKYKWNLAPMPEIALAAATLSVAVPTLLVLREKAKAIKEARDAGPFARLVLWWRHRKAGKAQPEQEGAPAAPEGAGDGVKQ